MTVSSVPFATRLWLSWWCAIKVLFDGVFAARVAELRNLPSDALPAGESESAPTPERTISAPLPKQAATEPAASPTDGALQLLTLLQREGRFVDFVEQEITTYSDADIGAAARVVHEGCRRALHSHGRIVTVRPEVEGAALTLEQARADVKLVGNVAGSAPYRGKLRHRGWRVEELSLPKTIGVHDARIIAPAELELS